MRSVQDHLKNTVFLMWLGIGLILCGCQPPVKEHTVHGKTMGTTWSAILVGDADEAVEAETLIQSRFDELEAIFSTWKKDSAVATFNASPSTDWQPVPQELADVAAKSQQFSRITHGAYDITMAPLLALWGFGSDKQDCQPPSDAALAKTKALTGWQKLEVSTAPPRLRKRETNLQIDPSSLVEGYALDDISAKLRAKGISHFLLEVGGEMIASGTKQDGKAWTVGIQRPGPDRSAVATSTPLIDQAISTSGVYQQYWEHDGQQYSHVLDARTGRPVEHRLQSVSVKATKAIDADGWTTVLLILGPQEGHALAKAQNVSAVFLEMPQR